MTWLTPLLGGIIAAVAVPTLIILYFLKLRRQDIQVSSTFLWKKAIQDLQANAPFQKLRRNLLLFLQLLVLAGLCIALAQPQIAGQNVVGNRHVILIDRSASMLALDERDSRNNPITRLESAKLRATAFVESLRESGLLSGKDAADEAMVITFDTAAEVRQQFTSDKASLKNAINAITPSQGPTLVEEAFRLAQAHKPRRLVENVGMEQGPPMTVHLYSDGRLPDALKAKLDPNDTLEYYKVGSDTAFNVGIVGLRAAREYEDPSKIGVFVSLQNNRPLPTRVDVELLIDGVSAALKETTIPAATDTGPKLSAPEAARAQGQERLVNEAVSAPTSTDTPPPTTTSAKPLSPGVSGAVFNLTLPTSAVIQVRVRDPGTAISPDGDVLPLDDAAYLVIPPAKKLAVAMVSTQSDSWLDLALGGLPLSRLNSITPEEFTQWGQSGRLGEYDVIILENWLPPPGPDGKPADLPPGSYLIFGGVPGGSLGLKDTGKTGPVGIVDWSTDHPILRNIPLMRLRISEMRRAEIVPASGATVLATSDDGPAILESTANAVHAVVMPFKLDDTTWAVDPGFVVFVGAAIRYLGEDVGAGATLRDIQPGSVVNDRLPGTAADITVKTPDGQTLKLNAATDGRITFGPLATTGLYDVSWTGPSGPVDTRSGNTSTRLYAANLSDPAESDLAAIPQLATASTLTTASGVTSTAADQRLWPYLLLAALAIAMIEWYIYNRKVYI